MEKGGGEEIVYRGMCRIENRRKSVGCDGTGWDYNRFDRDVVGKSKPMLRFGRNEYIHHHFITTIIV